jgi:hypothetical protein
MSEYQKKIDELLSRLHRMTRDQKRLSSEIHNLQRELFSLKQDDIEKRIEKIGAVEPHKEIAFIEKVERTRVFETDDIIEPSPYEKEDRISSLNQQVRSKISSYNPEKFIGENLASIIGITITILGAGIGVKYAIDQNLISPVVRILLGYLLGAILVVIGLRLKPKYEFFSATLLSGGLAIFYFVTFAAHSYYSLFSQWIAFAIMVLITISGVIAALVYNRQLIAHIGLIGAYAVPFMLGDPDGNAIVLFTYMVIINIGILILAFKKYWKLLYYVSFLFTWLIFFYWYFEAYDSQNEFSIAALFASAFFLVFYTMFLAYKLIQKEKFEWADVVMLLLNSFVFYGIGYSLIGSSSFESNWLGMFTLANALIHGGVCTMVYSQNLGNRNLFYLISALSLIFLTIAIPVQFDGNWVTLLWVGQATILFCIGRYSAERFYEKMSYPLMIVAFLSILADWSTRDVMLEGSWKTPLLNIDFISSALFLLAFGVILSIHFYLKKKTRLTQITSGLSLEDLIITGISIIVLFISFSQEIILYWDRVIANVFGDQQVSAEHLKGIWLLNYFLLFNAILIFVNTKYIRSKTLGFFTIFIFCLSLVMVGDGFRSLQWLHDYHFSQEGSGFSMPNIIRFITYVSIGITFMAIKNLISKPFMETDVSDIFDILLHLTIVIILSLEIYLWADLSEVLHPDKLYLSILWGIYSLGLITIGILSKKKHLRYFAIFIFAITLGKLGFYDVQALDTISKTILFVSIGLLLLIISFLYNRYKDVIFEDKES